MSIVMKNKLTATALAIATIMGGGVQYDGLCGRQC